MKTLPLIIIAVIASLTLARAEGPAEKAADIASDTVDTAKNVGHSVARGTKKAYHKVVDAVTPDPDAKQVNVTLTDDRIDVAGDVGPGKTAFVVKNAGKEEHNFRVVGNGTDRKFQSSVAPDQTKVLHVNIKHGTYTVSCPGDHHHKAVETKVTVK
jgi:hypothetical protein